VVAHDDGITKLHFKDLPAEVSIKYGYEPAAAEKFNMVQQLAQIKSQNAYNQQVLADQIKHIEAQAAEAKKEADQAVADRAAALAQARAKLPRNNASSSSAGTSFNGSEDVKVHFDAYGRPYSTVTTAPLEHNGL
jgi:hypothetical protein